MLGVRSVKQRWNRTRRTWTWGGASGLSCKCTDAYRTRSNRALIIGQPQHC